MQFLPPHQWAFLAYWLLNFIRFPPHSRSQPHHPTWLKLGVKVFSGEGLWWVCPSCWLQSSWMRLRHSWWEVYLQSREEEQMEATWGYRLLTSIKTCQSLRFLSEDRGKKKLEMGGCTQELWRLCSPTPPTFSHNTYLLNYHKEEIITSTNKVAHQYKCRSSARWMTVIKKSTHFTSSYPLVLDNTSLQSRSNHC